MIRQTLFARFSGGRMLTFELNRFDEIVNSLAFL